MPTNNGPLYLFANWKMYLDFDESIALARSLKESYRDFPAVVKTAVFPTALAFSAVKQMFSGTEIAAGAQNIYWIGKGGCTGEISAEMYKAAGATYALVGHSERRHLFKETNHEVRQKMEGALAAGIIPVLCVGETAEERRSGQTMEVLEAQIRSALTDLTWPAGREAIIAYEPVWAIGSGEACEPEEAAKVAETLTRFVSGLLPATQPRILYGGSVRDSNARAYLSLPHISGVLVGGASTKLDSWLAIVEQARP